MAGSNDHRLSSILLSLEAKLWTKGCFGHQLTRTFNIFKCVLMAMVTSNATEWKPLRGSVRDASSFLGVISLLFVIFLFLFLPLSLLFSVLFLSLSFLSLFFPSLLFPFPFFLCQHPFFFRAMLQVYIARRPKDKMHEVS
jgi:hypothetical protein